MRYVPISLGASVVALGSLNPAILSPAWLKLRNVISEDELETAAISVIHPEISIFNIDTIKFEATPQKFSVETTVEPFIRLADICRIIFGDLLPHTPVRKLGINYMIHFDLDSPEHRMRLGRSLAPLGPWTNFGKSIQALDDTDSAGGIRTLVLERPTLGEAYAGYTRVTVEPSVKSPKQGVFMQVNRHMEFGEETPNAECMVDALKHRFDGVMGESKSIVAEMMDYASGLTE